MNVPQELGMLEERPRYICGFLLFATLAFRQVTPTRIGKHQINETLQEWYQQEPDVSRQSTQQAGIEPHRVGETFAEWLKLNQLDLGYICGKHNRGDTSMDFKSVCKKLTTMQGTGYGDFYTTNQTGRTFGWRFADGKVADYSVDGKWQGILSEKTNELVTHGNSREYTWKFADEKLSEVSITPDWDSIFGAGVARHEVIPVFQKEVDFLTQIYGKPSKVEMVPYQNGFGAHWERSMVVWNAPDDTLIVAFESSEFNQQGQLSLVSFNSKESADKTQSTKPQSL
jgi:hypothetical protein